jgi:hypothetical protein
MRRGPTSTPWGIWTLGWLIAIVFTGGVVYVITDTDSPLRVFKDPVVVDTTIRDVHVLPERQIKLDGTLTRLAGGDVIGPPLHAPLQFPAGGGATIEDALVDGRRATIVWDGGRPFVLEGDGGIDLGPVRMAVEADGTSTWALSDGVRSLLEGTYQLRTPVAVGRGGLAQPRDQVTFTADNETTIETTGVAAGSPAGPLHLEGPGTLILDGAFTMRSREGTRKVTHLEFGPGSFVVGLSPGPGGVHLVATLQGEVRNVK